MYVDISRDSFDAATHTRRVLLPQGQVFLDAHWNEQTSILLHYLEALTRDLFGPYAGAPAHAFRLTMPPQGGKKGADLTIRPGNYYVDGILCENADEYHPFHQPSAFPTDDKPTLLVYLDAWEQAVTPIEDPTMQEVALGSADAAARSRVFWQVRVTDSWPDGKPFDVTTRAALEKNNWKDKWLDYYARENRGTLKAQVRDAYSGAENRLYRVEIHSTDGGPTFKWSRDNGTSVYPVQSLIHVQGKIWQAKLKTIGRDGRSALRANDIVELLDAHRARTGTPGPLASVAPGITLDAPVTLQLLDASDDYPYDSHPFLRRWDQPLEADGSGAIKLDETGGKWMPLEDGIRILFERPGTHIWQSTDYWLIPARTAKDNILWQSDEGGNPLPSPPQGIKHHYAPLAIVKNGVTITQGSIVDCRTVIRSLTEHAS